MRLDAFVVFDRGVICRHLIDAKVQRLLHLELRLCHTLGKVTSSQDGLGHLGGLDQVLLGDTLHIVFRLGALTIELGVSVGGTLGPGTVKENISLSKSKKIKNKNTRQKLRIQNRLPLGLNNLHEATVLGDLAVQPLDRVEHLLSRRHLLFFLLLIKILLKIVVVSYSTLSWFGCLDLLSCCSNR